VKAREDPRTLLVAGACALAATGLYFATAARDITLGDTAELVTVAATLGVAHPPGYPLLTLLAHLLTVIAPGPIPFRANLLSVVAGGITTGLVVLVAHRLTANRIAAAGAALLLTVQPLFWEWSLALEAFALNACLALAVLYALIRWDEDDSRPSWLVVAALFTGLGVANHLTIVAVAAPALVALWIHRRALFEQPKMALLPALALLPGFLLYGYLPWAAARGPALNWGQISSFSDLAGHFLRTDYGTFTLSSLVSPSPPSALLGAFFVSFTAAEAVLVGTGLVLAALRRRQALWTLGLTALLSGPIFAGLSSFNLDRPGFGWILGRFFVLPHALLAPIAAFAIAEAWSWLTRVLGPTQARLVPVTIGAALGALILSTVWTQYGSIDQRSNHLARQFATDILASLPPHAVLVSSSDAVTLTVAYLQAVESARPDVTQLMTGPLSRGEWYIRELRLRDRDLKIPFERYDPISQATSLRAIVDANPDRTFVLMGAPPDGSLEPAYWLLPMGLTLVVEPQSRDVALVDLDAGNDRLFAGYTPPPPTVHRHVNLDPYVLLAYASGARLVGLQFLGAQRPADAARWLRRALAIDPSDDETAALLRR
jgi:hypothetical protein